MDNKAIVLKQKPIIEYSRMDAIAEQVKQRLSIYNFDKLLINEDTVKGIKELRSTLNKEKETFENERKEIKKQVLAPYDEFNGYYDEKIKSLYDDADAKLKKGIDEVENKMKAKKKAEVKAYFEELLKDAGIDFVTYEQAEINVTLSASLKSLKETAKAFVDTIASCVELIGTQENQDRIMAKYKKTLNAADAIREVAEEIKFEQEREAKREAERIAQEESQKAIKEALFKEEPLEAPVVAVPKEEHAKMHGVIPVEIIEIKFTVKGTREQIVSVREFMKEKGISYE